MEALVAHLARVFAPPVSWGVAVAMAGGVFLVGELLYRLSFALLQRLAGLTTTTLDDVLVKRLRLPARVLVFLFSAHVLLALRQIENAMISKVVTLTELLLVAYLVIETLETLFLHYWLGERQGVVVPNVVRHLLLVIIYTVAVLFIVGSVTGINIAPVLATSTVVTVVVGLALQDTLGNLFAGLAMSMDRPFKPGDWILFDGVEGCVVYSGWRATHLQTFTRDIVVVPNSMLSKARLQNFYAPTKICGRNQEVIVALHASPEDVEKAVQGAIAKVPTILRTPQHKVWFVQTTALFHRYIMRIYIDDFAIHDDVESDFMKAMAHELRSRGLSVGGAVAAVDATGGVVAAAAVAEDEAGDDVAGAP